MEELEYEYLIKIIIIGESGTGKSCILYNLLENRFKKNPTQTVAVEFGSKVLNLNGRLVKLQIWDTAGQERFKSVTKSYYRGAAAAIIVYDISNLDSFSKLNSWVQDARSLGSKDISLIIVGNKCDLKNEREVSLLEASKYCQENELNLLEASAATGENIEEAFNRVTRMVLQKRENGTVDGLHGIEPGPGKIHKIKDRSCSC